MKIRPQLPVTAKSPQPPFIKGGQGGILIPRITHRLLRIYTALTLMLCGGCAVGPDHRPPELPVPSHWSEPLAGGPTHRSESLAQWWQAFLDKQLNALMAKAMESNLISASPRRGCEKHAPCVAW